MSSGSVLTLLNPALSLIFSTAFFLLWRHQRGRQYLVVVALAYVASATGFVLQLYTLPIGLLPTRMLSNSLLMAGAIALSAGVILRFDRPVPYITFAAIALGGLAATSWFLFADPDVTWRVYIMNFAVGTMLLVTAARLWTVPDKSRIDNILSGLITFNGLTFFVRPLVTLYLGGEIASIEGLHSSLYWLVFTFSHAVISLVVTLTLITAAALDIVGDLKVENETDPLSGLLNRRGFETAAEAMLQQTTSTGLPVSLFLADLDHFKSINDNHGHHIGDRVIASFASVLRQVLGDGHLIGRVGGEEFAVMMRGTKAEAAELAAEGVRIAFSVAPTPGKSLGASRRLTSSFGVAERRPGEGYSELLARADVALYEAKKAGRDCVRLSFLLEETQPRRISTTKTQVQSLH